MQPQLERVVAQLQSAQARLHRLLPTLPASRWAERREPERWSVAECVAHLNLTAEAYLPLIRDALERARDLGGPAPARYRLDLMGRVLYHAAGPMPGFGRLRLGRVRTAPAFVPRGDLEQSRVMADFDRLQAEQVALTRAAEGLPLQQVQVVSPFDARVRYHLYSCLAIQPRHQLRHVMQAERVWAGVAS